MFFIWRKNKKWKYQLKNKELFYDNKDISVSESRVKLYPIYEILPKNQSTPTISCSD